MITSSPQVRLVLGKHNLAMLARYRKLLLQDSLTSAEQAEYEALKGSIASTILGMVSAHSPELEAGGTA